MRSIHRVVPILTGAGLVLTGFLFFAGASQGQVGDKKPTSGDKKPATGDKKTTTTTGSGFEIKTLRSYTGYLGTSSFGPGSVTGPFSNPFTPSVSNPFSNPFSTPSLPVAPSTSWTPPFFQQNPWSNPWSNNFWNNNPWMNTNPLFNSPLNNNPWGNPWSNMLNNNPWTFSPNSNPWGMVQWNNPFQPNNFFQIPNANPFAPINANPWNSMFNNAPIVGIGPANPNPFNPNPFGPNPFGPANPFLFPR